MPREPLLKSHAEGVDVLVHLLNQSDSLYDGLVLSVNICGTLLSRVGMGETKLSLLRVIFADLLENLGKMSSDPSDKLLN